MKSGQQSTVNQALNMFDNQFKKSRDFLIPPIYEIIQLFHYNNTKTHIGFDEDQTVDASRQDAYKVIILTFFNNLHKHDIDYNEYGLFLGMNIVQLLCLLENYHSKKFNEFYFKLRESIREFNEN